MSQSPLLNPEPSPARILASISTPTPATPPSPSCANILFRRLLAQPSTRSQAKHLGRQTPASALAEIWFPPPLSRPANQRTEIFVSSRQQGNLRRSKCGGHGERRRFSFPRDYFSGHRGGRPFAGQVSRLSARVGRCARARRLSFRRLLLRNARQRRPRRDHHRLRRHSQPPRQA